MNEGKKEIFQLAVIFIGLVFTVKLFIVQVLDDRYGQLADSNSILRQVEYPFRGLIYDRNHKLIVYNTPEYDLEVIVNDIKQLDSGKFCSNFHLTREELRGKFKELKAHKKEYSPVKPMRFIERLSNEDLARVEDHLDEFPGFFIQARTARAYSTSAMANALGYVSEISKESLKKDESGIYKQGDYIGQSGLELYYEKQLRGKRGLRFKLRDVKGIEKGAFNDGKYDTLSVPGEDLVSSVDLDLQLYGEKLMKGKAGSIVALEPSTGEILSLVSGPSYDPNLLTGKNYSVNFKSISTDTLKPLFNRPLMAQYRPGSIFKIVQALTALQEGVVTPETRIQCIRKGMPGGIVDCHGEHSNEDLRGAIANSCNPYFLSVLRRMLNKNKSPDPFTDTRIGLEEWDKHINSFGFGNHLGIDLPNEKDGLIPTPKYYDAAYKNKPWKFSNIYSIAIGEGENLVVPLQMANFAATVANRGFYFTPHLIKSIGKEGNALPQFSEKHFTTIDSSYFRIAVDAMQYVVEAGTGRNAWLPDVVVCGKTGTVQMEPISTDHSVFIAFAPRENPKIAISVYVENAGQGARAGAMIASLMIEKYLFGKTRRQYVEDFVLAGKFLD